MPRLALKEDHTTTGGRVLGGSSDFYAEDGRPFALDGDKATCGNCKGLWPILGSAHDWMDKDCSMVKDLDPVHCPCGKNRVFASGSSPFDYETGGSEAVVSSAGQWVSSDLALTDSPLWIKFVLGEQGNCEGLRCLAHFTDGSVEEGIFDSDNKVHFDRPNSSACQKVDVMLDNNQVSGQSVMGSILTAMMG